MFGKHWTRAQGTVVAKHATKTTGDGMVTIYEFAVDVLTPSGEVFRARVDEPRIATHFRAPTVGETVGVEFDPDSRKVRFDKDDPVLSTRAAKDNRVDAFEQALAQQPGTTPGPMPLPDKAMAYLPPDVLAKLEAALAARQGSPPPPDQQQP